VRRQQPRALASPRPVTSQAPEHSPWKRPQVSLADAGLLTLAAVVLLLVYLALG
jgi:hypothetical protein